MTDHPESTTPDPLALAPLFEGGEAWLPILKPALEKLPQAAGFIGPKRSRDIVPVRELTFQALKPNPPGAWKVVVFGQNPYPRVESATGIAMFDNTFEEWKSGRFGRVTSMRCIIKAACMLHHGVDRKTTAAQLRKLLAQHEVVQPPEWFQSVLTQGVLLLNSALSINAMDAGSTHAHVAFWKPIIERIVAAILEARASAPPAEHGVVFAWWGNHARTLRPLVERVCRRYPKARVRHVDHCNPAAMGDAFCKGDNPLGAINDALEVLGQQPINWLPGRGWDQHEGTDSATAARMGDFVTRTAELHKLYLERLQDVLDEGLEQLPPITGVMDMPLMSFGDAAGALGSLFSNMEGLARSASSFAQRHAAQGLSEHEIAAINLYTMGSMFYRRLNAALRDPNRAALTPYRAYLRLLFSALSRLRGEQRTVWRGVAADLRGRYPRGAEVTWWGVSSCSASQAVARNFSAGRGPRTIFEVQTRRAVAIQRFSAFKGEQELLLAPGTRLKVTGVKTRSRNAFHIQMQELDAPRLVS